MAWVFMAANVSVVALPAIVLLILTLTYRFSLSAYCAWENKARREGRRQGNIERYQELWRLGQTRAPIGDRHPDFRFTL